MFPLLERIVDDLIQQGFSVILCLIYIIRKTPILVPERQHFAVGKKLYRELTTQGLSMGFMNAVVSSGTVILQSAINGLGEVYIACHATARKLNSFCLMPVSTIGASMSTFVSQNRGAGKHDRDFFARAHDILDMGEKLAAECAARMRASEVFLCKALGVHTSNGQCIAHCQRGRGRRRGREVERAGFKGHVHIEVDIGVTCKRTFRISRNRNELGAFAFDNRDDREQLVGSARVRNADDDIIDRDHTQVAVGGFGGMHEKGGRTGGGMNNSMNSTGGMFNR